MKREIVNKRIDFDEDLILTSIDEAISNLKKRKEILEGLGWTDMYLKIDYGYEYYSLDLYGSRLENDMEFKEREDEIRAKVIKEEKKVRRERRLYEKLKKKFEE